MILYSAVFPERSPSRADFYARPENADQKSKPIERDSAAHGQWRFDRLGSLRRNMLMAMPQRSLERTAPTVRAHLWAIASSLFFALTCTTALSARDPASARGYAPREIGDWTVTASKDGKGCFLTRTYKRPGDTTVLLGLDTDGTNRLSVLNANWSIKDKDRLTLTFRLSNSS